MKVIIQRVSTSSVEINKKIVGKIDNGYMVLVSFTNGDTKKIVNKMVNKIVNLRIFEDENDKLNYSLKDVNGSILSISQFTLCANTKKGNRPSYIDAMEPVLAKKY